MSIFANFMSKKSGKLFLLLSFALLFSASGTLAQSNEEIKDTPASMPDNTKVSADTSSSKGEKGKFIPSVGIGPGLMTFFGDVNNRTGQPIRYKVGYSFYINEPVLPFLDVSLFALSGDLYGTRRDTADNYNFRSRTMSFGLGAVYNFYKPFYNKASKAPFLNPYVGAGFEYINYETKTDLYDKNNQPYFYWKDGSIKDVPQTDKGVVYAKSLYRDYNYETPLTQGSTYGIPLSAGVSLNISPKFNLNVGGTYHITLTDKLDFIENGQNDNFLFTSVSLKWNIGTAGSPYTKVRNANDDYSTEDFLAIEKEDSDGDGIKDLADKCAGTLPGVQVDEFGCPIDDDKDGVPNYLDLEANSPLGSIVDVKGIAITDEYIDKKNAEEEAFLKGGENVEKVIHEILFSFNTGSALKYDKANKDGISFKVKLGEFSDGIPPDQVESFMRVQDITSSVNKDGATVYTAGAYGRKLAAESRQKELLKSGIKNPVVIAVDKNGNLVDINSIQEPGGLALTTSAGYDIVFKVQVGAYSNKIPSAYFSGIDQLSKEEAPNGLTRYLAGSFANYNSAVTYKNFLRSKGFDGSFVVAFKDGNRIDLGKAGPGVPDAVENQKTVQQQQQNTSPKFKIQIGLFKNNIPDNLQKQFSTFRDMEKVEMPNGLDKYTAGNFSSYDEAIRYKEELISKGVKGAFVISFIGNKQVPLSEALRKQ